MLKGFNSDITRNGEKFHIQTEDWGLQNPFIVSRIFRKGAVVNSLKIPYKEVLPHHESPNTNDLRLAMSVQHQEVTDLFMSNKLFSPASN